MGLRPVVPVSDLKLEICSGVDADIVEPSIFTPDDDDDDGHPRSHVDLRLKHANILLECYVTQRSQQRSRYFALKLVQLFFIFVHLLSSTSSLCLSSDQSARLSISSGYDEAYRVVSCFVHHCRRSSRRPSRPQL